MKILFATYKTVPFVLMVLLNESTATYMVHFDLCIKNTTGRCTEINVESPPYLPNNVPIVFLIHGWTSDGSASWYDSTIDALWQTNDQYHFIKVDWSIRSKTIYITAQSAVDEAGNFLNYQPPLNFVFVYFRYHYRQLHRQTIQHLFSPF